MRSEYFPGSSFAEGKAYRPFASLTTVMVMVEPAFLARTSTPSIAPSSEEDTMPVRACAEAALEKATSRSDATKRMTFPLFPALQTVMRILLQLRYKGPFHQEEPCRPILRAARFRCWRSSRISP